MASVPMRSMRRTTVLAAAFVMTACSSSTIPLAGGSAHKVVAAGLGPDPCVPPSIAVDATSIYWSEAATSLIRKAVPK